MSEHSTDDWKPFSVGKLSTRARWVEPSCQPLTSVSHVTHIRYAFDVLRDGQISPQLIYDESRLNSDRILVVWLSPNDWSNAGGFRYGNIAFTLDWPKLIAGKRLYWVGAMKYRPRACRILVTDQDRDEKLLPYDPTAGNGPWWHETSADQHYWNGSYCLELMFEGAIELSSVQSLRFVTHHPQRCSVDPRSCQDRGLDTQLAGARFLAGACVRSLLRPFLWLTDDETPSRALATAWNEVRHQITRRTPAQRGTIALADSVSAALARSALSAISERRKDDCRELIALFRSEDEAIEACAKLIEADLDVPPGTLERNDD